MIPHLTFVTGGAASGKSAWAEDLVAKTALPKVYMATAQAFDDEMRTKIRAHVAQRGEGWQTVDVPRDAAAALTKVKSGQIVLLDCATMWLSNHLLDNADIVSETDNLLKALATCASPVVVVSNEVGMGIVPDNALSRAFRQAQGRLNQQIAEQADLAVFVAAGLPLVLKGSLP